jgi:hypothetical protein
MKCETKGCEKEAIYKCPVGQNRDGSAKMKSFCKRCYDEVSSMPWIRK